MLIKKDLIPDKIATPVKKKQDTVLTKYQTATQKKYIKKILFNTTITTSAVIYGCNCNKLTSY
jgi:ketopantoate reductase